MFGSETLEVAIGLVVLFSFMSLFATAVREAIEAYLKKRGQLIHQALEELFAKPGTEGGLTVKDFYDSILISPLFRKPYDGKKKGNLPSYIPSRDFAASLIDLAQRGADEAIAAAKVVLPADKKNAWIDHIGDQRIADLIRIAFERAGGDADKAHQFVANWFDSQMDRVSGWYKRDTNTILIFIGFASAAVLNVDAIAVTQHLYLNDGLREGIVARAEAESGSAASGVEPNATPPKAAQPVPPAGTPPAETTKIARPTDTTKTAGAEKLTDSKISNTTMNEAANAAAPDKGEAKAPTTPLRTPDEILADLDSYRFPIGWRASDQWELALVGPEKWVWPTAPTAVPQCALRAEATNSCDIGVGGFLLMFLGWAITAFAISLGAPFWFDVLNKIMVIRSTVKPFEKSQPEGSEDRPVKKPEVMKLEISAAGGTSGSGG